MLDAEVILAIDELIDKIEKDDTGTEIKRAAKGLIDAINDWPTGLTTIEDFISEMKNEFGAQISKRKLEKYLNLNEAWKMESTASTLKC